MKPYYERDGITIYHGDCRELEREVERLRERCRRLEEQRLGLQAELADTREQLATAVENLVHFDAGPRIAELEREVERLRGVLRWTHETYCTSAYTDRGLHAPECLLNETMGEWSTKWGNHGQPKNPELEGEGS